MTQRSRDRAVHLVSLGSHLEGQGGALKGGQEPDWKQLADRLREQLAKASPEGSSWKITYTAPKPEPEAEKE